MRKIFSRLSIVALAGVVLTGCVTQDQGESITGTSQGFTVGDPSFTAGAGNTGIGPNTIITTTSITPNVSFTPGTQEELRAVVGDRVFFSTDSSTIDGRARAVLDQLASWMNSNPSRRIRIEGHADERGTREYNLALGDRRANAVVSYLTQRGISASRLNTISFGKERPVAGGSNATAWTQNRRAVFRVQ